MDSENSDFKTLGNSFVIGWVVKTIVAIIAGTAMGGAVNQLLVCSPSVARELLGAILLGMIMGAFVGVAQSTQLSKIVRDPKLWVIASIAGWTIAIFLFEINWPVFRCLTSSNSPSYRPGAFIHTIHNLIDFIARPMLKGQTIYGGIYKLVTTFYAACLIGVTLGLPQGAGQWWVLRKELPRSSKLIWIYTLNWAAVFFILFNIDLINLNPILLVGLIIIVLIETAAAPAFMLIWLHKPDG